MIGTFSHSPRTIPFGKRLRLPSHDPAQNSLEHRSFAGAEPPTSLGELCCRHPDRPAPSSLDARCNLGNQGN